ncbi:UDP-glucose 4-epimerase GalE [Algimonas ampicilliniresistens]|uniref:UDP-glucose 4-epimerase n=1 Tax=Algimonas ampicilliniresistens TaxID=1298735 RepID=A0ABQ5V5H9_9PROT|nr:UDP-glucose 4-epimerase GalE [Algimonas ampicilliniresistens]GLQ22347.1 UDP-glucose 4-epimerase GalE [Algimonas ampicilliniresistens]
MYDLTGQDILVVGGAGYIGSHVCKMIAENGGRPITLDNLSSGHKHAVQWGPIETVDLRDRPALDAAFARWPDLSAVIHLASSIEVGIGERMPAEFYSNNVIGALNLLDAMRAANVAKLIFSSTCATYGETEKMPIEERDPQLPVSVYGKTKLAIEHMIQSYHKAYDLAYVTLRYFNASGADASGLIGEEHDPETHLIPLAMQAAMGQRGPLTLFGTDYDTADGTCVRDYIHVSDIARAHVLALEKMAGGLSRAEVNIGTGNGISNLEILETIGRVTGQAVPYENGPRRRGDLSRLYADKGHAKAVLGFEPIHSDIETIIRSAWAFHARR